MDKVQKYNSFNITTQIEKCKIVVMGSEGIQHMAAECPPVSTRLNPGSLNIKQISWYGL
jgi:hypothetical protein